MGCDVPWPESVDDTRDVRRDARGLVYESWRRNFAAAGLVEWARGNDPLVLVLLDGTVAGLFIVVVSFSADLQNRGGFTKLVGHGAGFFTGMAIHYWQRRLTE